MPTHGSWVSRSNFKTPVSLTGKELEIYTSLLGNLQYAPVYTRPDISTALNILGSAQANPT
jgi:hypothetical protein